MKNKEKLIARTYRISEKQDKQVKRKAKKYGGESAYIRALIEKDNCTICGGECKHKS